MNPPASFRLFLIFLVTLVTLAESTATSTLTVKSTSKYDHDTQKLYIYDELTLSAKYTTVICHAPCYSQTATSLISLQSRRCTCSNVLKSFPITSKVRLFMKDTEGQWIQLKQTWSYNVKSQFEAVKNLLEDDISKQLPTETCGTGISNPYTVTSFKSHRVFRSRVQNMGLHINMDSHIPQKIINQNQGNLLCYKTVITYDKYTSTDYSDNCSLVSISSQIDKTVEGSFSATINTITADLFSGSRSISSATIKPLRKRRQSDDPFTLEIDSINFKTLAKIFREFRCDVTTMQYGWYIKHDLSCKPNGLGPAVWVEYKENTASTWNHLVDLQWKRYKNGYSNRFEVAMHIVPLIFKLPTNSLQIRCRARFQNHFAKSQAIAFSLD